MVKYITIIIMLFCMLIPPCNATKYMGITDTGGLQIVEDIRSTKERLEKVDNYVSNWSKRNNPKNELDTYYRIRNHIARLTTYDNDGKMCYTPYGLIYNGRAVCMAYALLAKLMFDAKDIENILIYNPSANHLYNRIMINGVWRDVDITYYDTGLEKLIKYKE